MDIVTLLTSLGIDHAHYPYLFLAALVVAMGIYTRISLGKPLGKVKDNVLVIITHLTTTTWGKLDTTLIKQMSPLQIQPQGIKILEESGFVSIIEKEENLRRFFDIVDSKDPKTKFEVENYSIFSFLEVFSKDGLLTPIKAYLYQNPNARDAFSTLAGIYIRDKYLSAHPEITQ